MELTDIIYHLYNGYYLVERGADTYIQKSYDSIEIPIKRNCSGYLQYFYIIEHDSGSFDFNETTYTFNRDFVKDCKKNKIESTIKLKEILQRVNTKIKIDYLLKEK